jgi:hypothetical protein
MSSPRIKMLVCHCKSAPTKAPWFIPFHSLLINNDNQIYIYLFIYSRMKVQMRENKDEEEGKEEKK